jgi:hypothetical protein
MNRKEFLFKTLYLTEDDFEKKIVDSFTNKLGKAYFIKDYSLTVGVDIKSSSNINVMGYNLRSIGWVLNLCKKSF